MTPTDQTAPERRFLGIFAKEPRPGIVKTRLAAAVSAQWAAQVAEAFLRDTVERLRQITARRILCFTPPDALTYFESLAAPLFTVAAQSEGDLGRRMAVFFADCFRTGADQ